MDDQIYDSLAESLVAEECILGGFSTHRSSDDQLLVAVPAKLLVVPSNATIDLADEVYTHGFYACLMFLTSLIPM